MNAAPAASDYGYSTMNAVGAVSIIFSNETTGRPLLCSRFSWPRRVNHFDDKATDEPMIVNMKKGKILFILSSYEK
ncbi:hypothetical protein BER93_09970 [Xanthomonas fragariae]|nr:hypothetical protein BER92_09945 [Xanthomonas fragariae]AOD18407.1 hypothetical protein BER93_09970 [Xanthomonas fragariae]